MRFDYKQMNFRGRVATSVPARGFVSHDDKEFKKRLINSVSCRCIYMEITNDAPIQKNFKLSVKNNLYANERIFKFVKINDKLELIGSFLNEDLTDELSSKSKEILLKANEKIIFEICNISEKKIFHKKPVNFTLSCDDTIYRFSLEAEHKNLVSRENKLCKGCFPETIEGYNNPYSVIPQNLEELKKSKNANLLPPPQLVLKPQTSFIIKQNENLPKKRLITNNKNFKSIGTIQPFHPIPTIQSLDSSKNCLEISTKLANNVKTFGLVKDNVINFICAHPLFIVIKNTKTTCTSGSVTFKTNQNLFNLRKVDSQGNLADSENAHNFFLSANSEIILQISAIAKKQLRGKDSETELVIQEENSDPQVFRLAQAYEKFLNDYISASHTYEGSTNPYYIMPAEGSEFKPVRSTRRRKITTVPYSRKIA